MKEKWMKLKMQEDGDLMSKGKVVKLNINLIDHAVYQRGSWIWTSKAWENEISD